MTKTERSEWTMFKHGDAARLVTLGDDGTIEYWDDVVVDEVLDNGWYAVRFVGENAVISVSGARLAKY